jgi:hypothetical protein
MQRRAILNLALGVLVVAIAALLWLVPPEEKAPAPVLVPGVDPARIDAIRVQRTDLPELRFRRNGGTWTMTAPVTAPAHDARINALLGLLADQSLSTLPASDLARFGLAEPAVIVEIGPHRIALGDSHPIDAQRYVLYDETVHLVPDSLYPQLVQNAGFFLDSRLLPPEARPIRIRYPAFTLEAGTDGWHEIPPGGRDAIMLSSVIDGWKSSRALAVRAPAGTAETLGTIAIENADGTAVEFEIRSLEPAPVLARRDLDVQYHLDALTGSQLLLGPSPAPPPE